MAAAAPVRQEREIPNLDWYLGLDEEDDIVIGDFIQRLMMNRDPRERIQIPHPRVFGELPRTAPRPAQPITNPFAPTPRQIRLRQEAKDALRNIIPIREGPVQKAAIDKKKQTVKKPAAKKTPVKKISKKKTANKKTAVKVTKRKPVTTRRTIPTRRSSRRI